MSPSYRESTSGPGTSGDGTSEGHTGSVSVPRPEGSERTEPTEESERTRSAAVCDGCGAIFTAWVWPDERVQPIGGTGMCSCDEIQPALIDGANLLSD